MPISLRDDRVVADRVAVGALVGVGERDPGLLVPLEPQVVHDVARRPRVELDAVEELGDEAVRDRDVVVAVVEDAGVEPEAVDDVAVEVDRDAGRADDEAVAAAVDEVVEQPRALRQDLAAGDLRRRPAAGRPSRRTSWCRRCSPRRWRGPRTRGRPGARPVYVFGEVHAGAVAQTTVRSVPASTRRHWNVTPLSRLAENSNVALRVDGDLVRRRVDRGLEVAELDGPRVARGGRVGVAGEVDRADLERVGVVDEVVVRLRARAGLPVRLERALEPALERDRARVVGAGEAEDGDALGARVERRLEDARVRARSGRRRPGRRGR